MNHMGSYSLVQRNFFGSVTAMRKVEIQYKYVLVKNQITFHGIKGLKFVSKVSLFYNSFARLERTRREKRRNSRKKEMNFKKHSKNPKLKTDLPFSWVEFQSVF